MEQNRQTPPTLPSRTDDEISLVDLWLILVQQKMVFLAVFLGCLALGLVIALTTPRTYTYFTTIELARQGSELLESPNEVLAKLDESYIPLVLRSYREHNPDDQQNYRINARIPRDSNLIVMEMEGVEDKRATYLALLQNAVAALEKGHDALMEQERMRIETDLQAANLRLEALAEQGELIANRAERLETVEQLLTRQVTELSDQIKTSMEYRNRAVERTTDEPQAMTLLLIDSEIERNRTRLGNLEKQLYVDLEDQHETLQKALADNRRNQEEQIQRIKVLEAEKVALRNTRPLVEPTPSLQPNGPRRSLTLALAGVLGLMAGLFSAFFAAFLIRARQQMAERSS